MKFLLDRLEGICIALFLAVCIGLFWPPNTYFGQANPLAGESDPYHATVFALLAVLIAAGFLARFEALSRLLVSAWPALMLVALAFLSAFWSAAPSLSLRKAATLGETTIFAAYLLARYDVGELVALLVKLFAFAAIASLVMIAVLPDLASSHNLSHVTAWRGAFTDKNNLGGVAALAILVGIYALYGRHGSRVLAVVVIVLNLVLLELADSKTPVVGLIAAAYVAALVSAFRRRSSIGLIVGYLVLLAGLAGAAFVIFDTTDALALLNRSPTLTSRTKIWAVTSVFFERHPWLGYGYSGFWRQNSVEALQVQALLQWPVPSAHNAWIEQGLWFGWVGIALLALAWLTAFYRVWRLIAEPTAQHVVFAATLLIFIFMGLIPESAFFSPAELMWVLFTVAIAYLGQQIARAHAAVRLAADIPARPLITAMPPATALSRPQHI